MKRKIEDLVIGGIYDNGVNKLKLKAVVKWRGMAVAIAIPQEKNSKWMYSDQDTLTISPLCTPDTIVLPLERFLTSTLVEQ